MTVPVFLTIDAALLWRHHADRHNLAVVFERSIEPADVGLSFQLARLARHDLKATFFVDPMAALVFGLDPIRRIVDTILDAGQEVQLHLDPVWAGAAASNHGISHQDIALSDYSAVAQRDLVAAARDLLVAAGAPSPIAFRASDGAVNDDTLRAIAQLGFAYDSSCNGSQASGASPAAVGSRQISPVTLCGVTEVPATLIEEHAGALCSFRVSTLSAGDMIAALDHAEEHHHAAVTIACDTAALANHAATRANGIHVRRFETLCAQLADRRETLPTCRFDEHPSLRLGQDDVPLAPHPLRSGWRNAEQLWSTMIEERAA